MSLEAKILDLFNRFSSVARVRISGKSTTGYMVEGRGSAGTPNQAVGIGTLRRVSGRLARSIVGASGSDGNESVFELTLSSDRAEIEIGTTTPYAGVHEFGFNGAVNVRAHSRRVAGGSVNVGAFVRNMRMPARPYLAPAIESQREWLKQWLADNGDELLKGVIE